MTQQNPVSPAENYQRYFVPAMFTPWARILVEQAAPRPGERVLDVACGTGAVTREVASLVGAGGKVTGLDFSPGMLAVARAQPEPAGAAIEWHDGDATRLPYADGSFDLVLCQQGMQFFPDRAAATREMRRVLPEGGRAVVSVWRSLEHNPVFSALFKATAKYAGADVGTVAVPFMMGDADRLAGLFSDAGFGEADIAIRDLDLSFPSPDRWVQLSVSAAAAAVPVFAEMDEAERREVVNAVKDEIAPVLEAYTQGESLVFPSVTFIVTARA
ncbi:MAG: methyltransferase domain-containing protein [Dehalococcoidia bacterium]